jgi:Fic family protein
LQWFNGKQNLDGVIKAALAHFWFITIHPFEDGNGRIARTLADMLLARADGDSQRYYSMSAQIRLERNKYYRILEESQKGSLDITAWMQWFLECLEKALDVSDLAIQRVLGKTKFWDKHQSRPFNERQRKVINRLFDGFEGALTSSKWAKICKCSADTAQRDIKELQKWKILRKSGGGRSTHYSLLSA